MPTTPQPEADRPARRGVVLRLLVRNHPGVMSHVCGLFARRAFNVEGILCMPVGDGARSVVLLLVHEDDRLEQVVRQLRKLEDVVEVGPLPDGHDAFETAAVHLV
jgi:acetolactate synthase I/III small subunit